MTDLAAPVARRRAPRLLDRSPLAQLVLVRIRAFFREPSTVFWSFGFPILLTIALGIAFRSRPPEPVRAAVIEGPGAEAVRAALAADPGVAAEILPEPAARTALRTGRAALVVVPGDPPTYRTDPTRPESRLARASVDDLLQRAAGRADVFRPADARVTEPGARYVDFLVPGLLGMNVMSAGMWGIGWVIVEDRQKKLLKRMVATPMRRSEWLLAFVIVRLFFLVVEVPVLVGFAMLAFDVPMRGSWLALGGVAVLGALAFSGLGLLVASRARNTQTVGGLINLVMMPMFILSGVFFSSDNFPRAMQPAIRALPLTALNDALRAVMNEGAGLAGVWAQAALLAAVAALAFGLALRFFRWS
ncbi:ABC transporter permease [Anaeromyxobacter oryzae]|uniref:ABC transporter permease n=1 Tax=Anaeromyxobacter oryzae TaxID=2918170 RepID=A0ABN6MMC8_9BACT|nr:ABC transporter permease [Anaeromyxobacter oryzae]BDG02199.1 ABC transporter permease [Anaeromyxobacter oryzae]